MRRLENVENKEELVKRIKECSATSQNTVIISHYLLYDFLGIRGQIFVLSLLISP